MLRAVRERGNRRRRRALVGLLAVAIGVAARPSPIDSGPRPPLPATSWLADPWDPPLPHVDDRFATLPYEAEDGDIGTWVVSDQRLPLRMVVEREVVDRFGLEALRTGLAVWNDVVGSRFAIELVGVVDEQVDRRRRDGVSRVFLDRTDCEGGYLARAHLHDGQVGERAGVRTNWVSEADIGICPTLDGERIGRVLRHEVAHIAGLGHLCDEGEPCHREGMAPENRCRVMYRAAYRCQERSVGDELGLIHLYPAMPRIRATADAAGWVAASRYAHRRARSLDRAVLVAADAPSRLVVDAAALAGARGAVFLAVGETCTEGPVGEELNRALAVSADVTLVGEVSGTCELELSEGWGLEVTRLADQDDVLDAVRAELEDPTVAVVVAERDAALADAVVALPVALRLGAPLLRADGGGLTDAARDLVRSTPSIERALIVGSTNQTTPRVESELARLGVRGVRLDRGDRIATTLGLWLDSGAFGDPAAQPNPVLLTSIRPSSLLTTAALAAQLRWPVLLTPSDSLDARIETALSTSASAGLLVGGVDDEVAVRASRALDS